MDTVEPMYLDLSGLRCPMPVLKIRQQLKKTAVFVQLDILTDHPDVVGDIRLFCRKNNYQCVDQEIQRDQYLVSIKA